MFSVSVDPAPFGAGIFNARGLSSNDSFLVKRTVRKKGAGQPAASYNCLKLFAPQVEYG